MATEIERKFLITDSPTDLPAEVTDASSRVMRQGYLAEEGDVEVRLRITATAATLTVKAGQGLQRDEVELPVTTAEAEQLWPHTVGRRLDKRRYRVERDGHTIEVDVYTGELRNLVVAEVEFPDATAAAQFTPPAWFGPELTGLREWSNAALARHGRPAAPA